MQFCNSHLILYGSHLVFLVLAFIHLLTHLSPLCPLEAPAQLTTSRFSLVLPIIFFMPPMPTTVSASSPAAFTSPLRLSFPAISQVKYGTASNLKMVSIGSWSKNGFPPLRTSSFRVSCAAKPETVQKVCDIVRKQLALPAETELTPDSKFSSLGADSLDTVEIVMSLEEEFGISVEEESSESITTVQEAADLIEKLVQSKS